MASSGAGYDDTNSLSRVESSKDGLPNTELPETAHIPSVRPVIDTHDRLWAQVDVLDEIGQHANEAQAKESFFTDEHAEALNHLRHAQMELAQLMEAGSKKHEESSRILWKDEDFDALREKLFDTKRFTVISNHVKDTIEKLDVVAQKLQELEERNTEYGM